MSENKIPIRRHPNCENIHCRVCLEDHEDLEVFFREQIGNQNYCWLEKYRNWLDANRIPSEKNGWASIQAFQSGNIHSFISFWKSEEEPE